MTLPKNWILAKLGEVCKNIEKVNSPYFTKNSDKFIYIDINSIDNKQNRIVEPKEYAWQDAPSRAQQILNQGDIVFSTVRTYLKNIAFVEEKYNNAIASTGFCVLRPYNKAVNNTFLFSYVLTENFLNKLNDLQRGTSYPAVRNIDILEQFIPLPPLAEQVRIVAKLEALLAELDQATQSLHQLQAQCKLYRQSVLQAAFEGKFTGGTEGWDMVKFGDVVNNYDGKRRPLSSSARQSIKGVYRYFGATEIVDYINDYIFDGKYLLIGEDGANLLSKSKPLAFIVEGKFWVNNHAHIVQTKNNMLLEFLFYYFNNLNISEYVTGSAQPKLNQANLNKIPIPLPPNIEIQKDVVAAIEARLENIKTLETSVEWALQQAEVLRQSLLQQAFEGKLVEQREEEQPIDLAQIKQALLDQAAQDKKDKQNRPKTIKVPKTKTLTPRTDIEFKGGFEGEKGEQTSLF